MNERGMTPEEVKAFEAAKQKVAEELSGNTEEQTDMGLRDPIDQKMEDNNYQDAGVTEEIQFDLTEHQLAQTAIEVNELSKKKKEKEIHLKAYAKEKKAEIETLQAEIDANLKRIEEGELRLIDCIKRTFFDKGIVQFIRDGEVIKERPMEDGDRQLTLTTSVPEDAFASESDAIDSGSKGIDYDENHAKAKEAEAAQFVDESEELEPITDKTLTSNTPVTF